MSDSPIPPRFSVVPSELPDEEPDPQVRALLDFEPVARRVKRPDGWSPELQRHFIRLIVEQGSPQRAAAAMGKKLSGIEALYREEGADSFRQAWDRAVDLAADRELARASARIAAGIRAEPPHRRRQAFAPAAGPLPGQVLNEHGEWEDEESVRRRAEDARDSISQKLLNCRRLYLQEISSSPGKRAAFEILTELPIDWDKAERLEAQADEPWRKPNMREPDMLLTAENGWMGEMAHGPDKKAELRAAVDAHRAEKGLPPVDWDESTECKAADAEQRADLHERCETQSTEGQPSSADGSRSEPDRPDVGFTTRDDTSSSPPSPTPPDKPGPRLRGL